MSVLLPFYKVGYALCFIIFLALIRGVGITGEVGPALEPFLAVLSAAFCADTYVREIVSRRGELWRLYPVKRRCAALVERMAVQEMFLFCLAILGYGVSFWFHAPRPGYGVSLEPEKETVLFLLYLFAGGTAMERMEYYLEKTSLTEHRKKKMRQLSGGMKRRVGLIQALLNEPEFLVVDEPTTGLDPEERIRIRNLLVEVAENRTVLFSTHVVEDLTATCKKLAVMKKGKFLYAGGVKELVERARGHVWLCEAENEREAGRLEGKYHVSSKQYGENGLRMKLISEEEPDVFCRPCEATLEDAYIFSLWRK